MVERIVSLNIHLRCYIFGPKKIPSSTSDWDSGSPSDFDCLIIGIWVSSVRSRHCSYLFARAAGFSGGVFFYTFLATRRLVELSPVRYLRMYLAELIIIIRLSLSVSTCICPSTAFQPWCWNLRSRECFITWSVCVRALTRPFSKECSERAIDFSVSGVQSQMTEPGIHEWRLYRPGWS